MNKKQNLKKNTFGSAKESIQKTYLFYVFLKTCQTVKENQIGNAERIKINKRIKRNIL